jgi:hypothetical protein
MPLLAMVQPVLDTIPENSESKKILTSLSSYVEVNPLTFVIIKTDLPSPTMSVSKSLICTRLVIVHRLSNVYHCNRIIVLDGASSLKKGIHIPLRADFPSTSNKKHIKRSD